MIVRIVLTALFVSALNSVSAFAQEPFQAGEWMLTPSIGLALDSDADPSLTLAGGAAYFFAPGIAVEGEIGHALDLAPGDADVDSSLTTIHGSVLYFLDAGYVMVPYLAGGIGIGDFSHDVVRPPARIDQTEFGFNLGAGVTYPLADGLYARGDFRFFKHIDNVPSLWRFGAGITVRIGD